MKIYSSVVTVTALFPSRASYTKTRQAIPLAREASSSANVFEQDFGLTHSTVMFVWEIFHCPLALNSISYWSQQEAMLLLCCSSRRAVHAQKMQMITASTHTTEVLGDPDGADQQHPTDIDGTGTTQNVDTARESQEAETGAKLEPEKHSQEQVAEPQMSCSYECPPQGSQDAVPEPAGDGPSLVAQTVSRRP
ncbi:hypothetical protein TURU_099328 [Turdus rufiventris]|nr:hypothetical protein TURU_099328 [Turdus rufiventris]